MNGLDATNKVASIGVIYDLSSIPQQYLDDSVKAQCFSKLYEDGDTSLYKFQNLQLPSANVLGYDDKRVSEFDIHNYDQLYSLYI